MKTQKQAMIEILLEINPKMKIEEDTSGYAINALWNLMTTRRHNLNNLLIKRINESKVKPKKAKNT